MPQLRTKVELANIARMFAISGSLVVHRGVLYQPVHFLDGTPNPTSPNETVWKALDHEEIQFIANDTLNTLFATDSEERSFVKMVKQFSAKEKESHGILVRIREEEVCVLNSEGQLHPAEGKFCANYLDVPYDEQTELASELFKIMTEWVDSEEDAHSILYHFATALQPSWSATRYVLFIGKRGRNGKSTLLQMIMGLLGPQNVSGITRQLMAARSSTMQALNGKLMNIVLDGPKEFVKDSSAEKTLIAGEPLDIELKYENAPFRVHTKALFAEGLQHEPLVSDRSPALQKRLVRFYFPNEYEENLDFEERMQSPEMRAALLHLLLTHWVNKSEKNEKLQKTAKSLDMQTQAVWALSPVLRFLEWMVSRDTVFLQDIVTQKMPVDRFMASYRGWLENNGYKHLEDSYVLSQLEEYFVFGRKTFRSPNPATKRYIASVTSDTQNTIQLLLSGEHITQPTTEETEILQSLEE